ncbi:unnamed protein product, partial [Mesorhabditis spiculigera]
MAMVPLGEGGYGEVWHLPDKEPQMVMKKVRQTNDTDSYLRYLKELKTLKDLIHENVVRYYDAPSTLNYPGINPDDLLLFMEYCEHLSLRHVIKDINLVYSMATIAQWSTEMFSALEYLKSMNIVHQDVKPANLFVHGPDYVLKLGDFGIVRDRNTIEKYRRGTPGYMPPKIEYDETQGGEDAYKYDIYGAGWVVLDIVNRRPGNRDIEEMFKDHRHLATLKRLVIGCTNEEVANRLSVEDALAHCKTMTKVSRHICECFLLPWFIAARQDGTGTFWENVTNRKLDNAFEENISSPVEAILNEGESGETGDRTDRAE